MSEDTPSKGRNESNHIRPWHALQVVKNSEGRTRRTGKITQERVRAIVAVKQGTANQQQQLIAMDAILVDICGLHDISYRPDELGGDRDTAFAEGKRYVATQIYKLVGGQQEFLKNG